MPLPETHTQPQETRQKVMKNSSPADDPWKDETKILASTKKRWGEEYWLWGSIVVVWGIYFLGRFIG